MATYIKQHYLHDHKLAQRALLEFHRALKTGRMIAFTGAMTTEAFGYGSWSELQSTFIDKANNILDPSYYANKFEDAMLEPEKIASARALIASISNFSRNSSNLMSATVAFSLIEEVFDSLKIKGGQEFEHFLSDVLEKERTTVGLVSGWMLDNVLNADSINDVIAFLTAQTFRFARHRPFAATRAGLAPFNVPHALLHRLGIRRFATLNYDFELERATMLGDDPEWFDSTGLRPGQVSSPFEQLVKLRRTPDNNESFRWNLGSGHIRRILPDGRSAESDILNRERTDRLLEFAIGGDSSSTHVMHMHGRACTPASMIVSQRDYNQLYRHSDLHRLPFEHAKRTIMAGNPVLFVGLGMSEADVNRDLEEFISNNPYRRVAPTFLLWNTDSGRTTPETCRMRRLDWLQRLGVLAIFDTDFIALNPAVASDDQFTPVRRPSRLPDRWVTRKFTEVKWQARTATPSAIAAKLRAHLDPRKIERSEPVELLRQDLTRAIECLPAFAQIFGAREEWTPAPGRWRSMQSRASDRQPLNPVRFWVPYMPQPNPSANHPVWLNKTYGDVQLEWQAAAEWVGQRLNTHPMVVLLGPSGGGRGYLSAVLGEHDYPPGRAVPRSKCDRLVISGGFSFDTDSLLQGLRDFIALRRPRSLQTPYGRNTFFESGVLEGAPADRSLMVVISGMERFFSTDNQPLSAELDYVLGLAARATGQQAIRWVFLGSERIRTYFEALQQRHQPSMITIDRLADAGLREPDKTNVVPGAVPSLLMAMTQQAIGSALATPGPHRLIDNIDRLRKKAPVPARELDGTIGTYLAQGPGAISGDIAEVRTAFYNLVLDPHVLAALFPVPADLNLAMQCLRVLGFAGSPVEVQVVLHAPRIWDLFEGETPSPPTNMRQRKVKTTLEKLTQLGLVVQLAGFPDYKPASMPPSARFALHRTFLTEIRRRFGIPLSEAKLSTAFNMSLYVAQPIDGYIPEPEIHDELGQLIDRLIGAYKDVAVTDKARSRRIWHRIPPDIQQAVTTVFTQQDPVRSKQDADEDTASSKTGPRDWKRHLCFYRMCLPEQVQRLRAALAVVRGYYSTTGILTLNLGDRLVREDRDGILNEHAERLETLIDGFGKLGMAREALRAVLCSTLGDVAGNRRFEDHFGKAEPFYADELVWLHNERGVVRLAMGDLYEARRSFRLAMRVNREHCEFTDRGHNWRRIRLNQLTVDVESAELDLALRKIEEIHRASQGGLRDDDPRLLREDQLARAILCGYRGFVEHMRGHRRSATDLYAAAIAKLDMLRELRAMAYFMRLRAATKTFGESVEERRVQLDRAHDLALSGRQMDIAYRIQVMKAETLLFGPNSTLEQRRQGNRLLDDAMRYALLTDTFRVRCEAAAAIAAARLDTADLEGALASASDALTVAVRYGLELRKMHLRALISRILSARGHPVTAEKLAMTAIKVASRQKIQWAIDHAERALNLVPEFSILNRAEDLSGKRSF